MNKELLLLEDKVTQLEDALAKLQTSKEVRTRRNGIICDLDGTIALMNGKRSPFEYHKCINDDPNTPVINVLETLFKSWNTKDKPYDIIFTTARMNQLLKNKIHSFFSTCKSTGKNIVASTEMDDFPDGIIFTKEWRHPNVSEDSENIYIHLTDIYSLTLLWILIHVNITLDQFVMFIREDDDTDKDRYVKLELYKEHIKPHWKVDLVLDDRNQVVEMWRHGAKLPCLQVADGNF
tara:strand:+ start:938 stop:1642 length:705 start_codon:yes stop_codon:yes gene_type:complete